MVTPSAGSVILVRFPFSDLSQSKLRPAVVLMHADRGDWILCQITSKPYGDARAVQITDADFTSGGLRVVSYARPLKLFTAHQSLFSNEAGNLKAEAFSRVRQVVATDLPGLAFTGPMGTPDHSSAPRNLELIDGRKIGWQKKS